MAQPDYNGEWGQLDSRDLIARREELESQQAGDLDTDELRELLEIRELEEEAPGEDSFESGVFFIREDKFVEYAEQLADEIGAVDRNANWPICHIDWDAAADSLSQDYSTVEFFGHTWYVR